MDRQICVAQLKPTYSPCVVIKLLWSLCTPTAHATGSIGIYNMMLNSGKNLCTFVCVCVCIYIYIWRYCALCWLQAQVFLVGWSIYSMCYINYSRNPPRCFSNQQVLSDPIVKGQVFISEFHRVQQGRLTCLHPWLRKSSISGESMWLCTGNSHSCAKKTPNFAPSMVEKRAHYWCC